MSNRLAMVLAALWAGAVLTGSAWLLAYKGQPAPGGAPPETWPASSALVPGATRPTLVMLAHPRCPCTQASVSELARLLARVGDGVTAYALVLRPEGTEDGWERSELARRLAGIPGVTVVTDHGGVEAERFHVTVSGHVLLYDRDRRLVFSGGLTPGRGHEGDSVGKQSLIAQILHGRGEHEQSPVFGCRLDEPAGTLARNATGGDR